MMVLMMTLFICTLRKVSRRRFVEVEVKCVDELVELLGEFGESVYGEWN
ncbi:hypothetical protein Hanom_Chr01g00055261 [Helianthus anomalus]